MTLGKRGCFQQIETEKGSTFSRVICQGHKNRAERRKKKVFKTNRWRPLKPSPHVLIMSKIFKIFCKNSGQEPEPFTKN